MNGFTRPSRTVLLITAFVTMFAGAAIISGKISGQSKKPPPTTPVHPATKTRLEIKQTSGGTEQWVESMTITSPQKVTFRYSTNELGAGTGVWQVSDKPFSSGPKMTAAQAPHVIASGPFRPAPSNARVKLFDIDFAQFPKPLAKAPRSYWVFVVTKNAQNQTLGLPSPAVKIVHYATLELKAAKAWLDKATKKWEMSLTLNYAPQDAEVVVQRLKNDPFPDVWWWADAWVNGPSVHFLHPKKISANHPLAGSGFLMSADLPSDVGAGSFQAQVRTKNPAQITAWKPFSIHYPPHPPGEMVLKYLGLQSLEETDEVGADELLILGLSGDVGITVRQVGHHSGVDKGETHPADSTVYVDQDLSTRSAAIAVVEIDDGSPQYYGPNLSQHIFEKLFYLHPDTKAIEAKLSSPGSSKTFLTGALNNYLGRQSHGNRDDIVAIIDLPLWNEDVQQCKKNRMGVRKEVIVEGDGGRFKLFFHLLAQPRKK